MRKRETSAKKYIKPFFNSGVQMKLEGAIL